MMQGKAVANTSRREDSSYIPTRGRTSYSLNEIIYEKPLKLPSFESSVGNGSCKSVGGAALSRSPITTAPNPSSVSRTGSVSP